MCDDTLSDLAGFNKDPAEPSSYLQVMFAIRHAYYPCTSSLVPSLSAPVALMRLL